MTRTFGLSTRAADSYIAPASSRYARVQRRGRDSKTGGEVAERSGPFPVVEEAPIEARSSTQSDVGGPVVDRAMVHVDRDDDVARLTRAIELAAQAQEWQVVRMLGAQLEVRTRATAGNVVELSAARRARS